MKALLAVLLLVSHTSAQFPNFVKLCNRNSDINECVKENINNAKKYIRKGIPRLFVQPTDPYKIERIEIVSPTLKVDLQNFRVTGLDDFDVKNVNIELENNKFEVELKFNYVSGFGKYQLRGSLLFIALDGNGQCFGNHTDLGIVLRMSGDRYQLNGKNYIDFTNEHVKLKLLGDGYMYFNNLFPYEDLTRVANQLLNQNVKTATEELKPVIEETIVTILSQSIQKLFEKYSIDELFPL